ncbi:LysR family transcriptional regulator [Azospirillum sp. A39]|uniref:LysR family transcriptional regulator n=1 Tax=Azospirillum sp. A39 TaxID=3462279 RepID=UPI004045ABFB
MADRIRRAPLDWDDLRYFLAVVRRGTLSAAARALGVNHATVSRRIASLETALGRTLFERRADGFVLTADGEAVLAGASVMADTADGIAGGGAAGEPVGWVRVATTRTLADVFLVPRLAPLALRHPALGIEVLADSRNLSLSRREADLALRWARPRDGELVARRVATVAHRLYGTPDGSVTGPPPVVTYDEDGADLPEARWLRATWPSARIAFRSNSLAAQAAAVGAGLGVAVLPCFLADAMGLAPCPAPPPPSRPPSREVWMLARRDVLRLPRVRAVADAIVAVFEAGRDVLGGGNVQAGGTSSTSPS